jgi:7-cyano-7-deazaguanine synthase
MKVALLLSGGMDSISIAYWKRPNIAITVDYGQVAAPAEVRASQAAAEAIGIEHHVIRADLSSFGSGDMAAAKPHRLAVVSEWWPFRNQMLITLAAMKGIALGIDRLMIGTLKTDERHGDGRRSFVKAMDNLLQMQEGAITLIAPAIDLTAVELFRISGISMDILAWAHSCHVSEYACGMCNGCRKHYETLAELGVQPY